jgi:hypothetical protein
MAPFSRKRLSRAARRRMERGVALVIVLIFLSIMLLLGLATTMTSITEVGIGTNLRLATESFNAADAGAAHAYALIKNMKGDFTCLLRGSNSTLKDGDEFQQRAPQTFTSSGTVNTTGAANTMFTSAVDAIAPTNGRALVRIDPRHFYELLVYDNNNDNKSYLAPSPREADGDASIDQDARVVVRSIGYVMDVDTTVDTFNPANAVSSAVVDVVIGLNPFPAVISNDDILIKNSIQITGEYGSVHANDDLDLVDAGNYYIEQTASYTNEDGTTPSGSNTTDSSHVGGYHGPSDAIFIPPLVPYEYADRADYIIISPAAGVNERNTLINVLTAKGISNASTMIATSGGDLTKGIILRIDRAVSPAVLVDESGGYQTSDDIDINSSNASTRIQARFQSNGAIDIQNAPDIDNSNLSKPGATFFALMPTGNATKQVTVSPMNGIVTIITNGAIFLNGNAKMRPAIKINPPYQPPWNEVQLMALAGEDVTMAGTAGTGDFIEGLLYAGEQFYLSGSAYLNGQIVAYERALEYGGSPMSAAYSATARSANSLVPAGGSEIRGNFEITHDVARGYLGTFSIVAWRQLRDFNPLTAAR